MLVPVPVAVAPPHDCQMIPLSTPVGSPPSEISDGRTCPKPATDGPTRAHAAAIPNVGPEAAAAEVVDVPDTVDVEVVEPVWCWRGGILTRTVVVVPPEPEPVDGELEHAAPTMPAAPTNTATPNAR